MATSTIIGIVAGVIILAILIGGITIFFAMRKGKKKYPFIRYSPDGKNASFIHATIKIDQSNPLRKEFGFEGNDTILPIRSPTIWINGTGYREIIQNDLGEYSYLEGREIDKKDYLAKAILPEEKQIALARLKENQKRYENNMNKYQAITMVTGFILVFIIVAGLVYTVVQYTSVSNKMVELAKENIKVTNGLKTVAEQLGDISEQQSQITAAMSGNISITRRIS